jgi:hypothetical protein
MAICNALSTGLVKSCDTNAGGVNKFWIGDFLSLSPSISGGEIVAITPDLNQGIYVITTTATITTTTVAGQYQINNIQVSGDLTNKIKVGKQIKFSYNTQTGGGNWTGNLTSVSYNSGTNITTITPDFAGFTPIVGSVAGGVAPNNTANQSITTYLMYEIETNKNVCNFTESASIDLTNGTTYFNQVLTLVLSRRETTKREFIKGLIDGQKQLVVVLLDTNGNYWLFGLNEGCFTTAIEGGSGTGKADANGYTITFTAMEPLQAYEIAPNAIAPYI